MKTEEFLKARSERWKQLERLMAIAQHNLANLNAQQLEEMANLYRDTASDFALAKREFPQQAVSTYLNQLVLQAHGVLYRQPPNQFRQIIKYFSHGFPQLFRKNIVYFWVSACLFIIPAILTGFVTYYYPASAYYLLPAEAQSLLPIVEGGELWQDIPLEERPETGSFIASNNIQVSLMAFAGGVTFGIFTAYMLVLNGLLLGVLTGYTAVYGLGWKLWEFVIGHGVLELTMIFLAGQSGLMLGWALLRPGFYSRVTALQIAARQAFQLVLMVIPLLLLAGIIESNISPNDSIPVWAKWVVGLVVGGSFYVYALSAGRKTSLTIINGEKTSEFR
ncbi:MAG TPA: stage II sporulation protein M [Anaerolineales bacterium]|nr:stage II sporulation protein M [Anaerolineales bacterium]